MFCPDGYVSWSDAMHLLHEWRETLECVDPEISTEPQRKEFARDVLHAWMLATLLATSSPMICSPNGKILTAPFCYVAHGDMLHWCFMRLPVNGCTEFDFYFKRNAEGFFNGEDLLARFCLLDAHTGLITIKNNSLALIKSAGWDAPDKVLLAMAERHKGWAVCWRAGDFPSSAIDFFASALFQFSDGTFADEDDNPNQAKFQEVKNAGGRPSLTSDILDAYDAIYPYGHRILDGEHWENVTRKLSAHSGRAFKPDTVAKAVNRHRPLRTPR